MYPAGCVPPNSMASPRSTNQTLPRPIVSSYWSVTYGVAKELAKILKPLVGKSPHHNTSTQDFVEQAKQIKLEPGECLSSYDVSAVFTSVPIDPSLNIIKDLLDKDTTPRKELLWKLVTLSSYWSFVSRTPNFLSKTSSMNRLRVLPWVPQSAPLWPISTWST